MTTQRAFAADSNKFAYAQAFSRTSAQPRSVSAGSRAHRRGLVARLHLAPKFSR